MRQTEKRDQTAGRNGYRARRGIFANICFTYLFVSCPLRLVMKLPQLHLKTCLLLIDHLHLSFGGFQFLGEVRERVQVRVIVMTSDPAEGL